MKQDCEQLNLLYYLHLVFGVVLCAIAVNFCVFDFIAYKMSDGSNPFVGNIVEPINRFETVIPKILIFLAFGIIYIIAALKLKARKSRTFCMVVAMIGCVLVPVGTALGIYTVGLLTNESMIQKYDGKTLPQSPGQPGSGFSS